MIDTSIGSSCVHRIFEEQAARRPEAVALVAEEGDLSYAELNHRANQLAHQLIRTGIGPDRPVGLFLERSATFVVAALAVLKAGGCYVPLDPEYPAARVAAMLADTQVSVVLTRAGVVDRLPRHDTVVLCLDEIAALLETLSRADPAIEVSPDHLAYIMYTSGSTGRPKGVMVPHRGVTRLVRGADYLELGPGEVLPLLSSVSFDASTFEIWGALANGARLVVGPATAPSIGDLGRLIERHGITTLWLTAGLFHLVVDELPGALTGVRQLLAGGDALGVPQVRRLLAEHPGCRLVNGYGPTEGTTFTTVFPLPANWQPGPSVPIGRPVAGTLVRVLDAELRPVAAGEPGQLFVGGEGLARGYLNQPGRTADRFVPDPAGPVGARLYATGDQVRELPDGSLEFLGRLDQQVKFRGYRVELGEIESVLREHPAVRDVAVRLIGDSVEDRRLVAYPVLERAEALAELRPWLADRLPSALVPGLWQPLDALPLTLNGKVDRAALPTPSVLAPPAPPAAEAADAHEREAVAAVFREVLGLAEARPQDDFFELGGHSLLAAKVVARLRRALGVELPISVVFDHPTVAALAAQARLAATGSPA
ncbi:non-ribosomal peptide synthetase [Kitasatospora viridis]|uniref:Amino acid adenylation domain-containing protein n=1 Tax=Kitasatospora viridis TaxID=281105 RepID=A0A561T6G8_9ACTN|nr:non-ribosomal peptide synthetase [Kitasatospora viridis]TWF82704.1 amino acid adenylation domain-containing protein [Kitasatospora viridis]